MAARSVRSASSYDRFAYLYSRTIAEDFCRKARPLYERLILNDLPGGARLLDVCCGTGQFAREFQSLGFRVTGLDTSPGMIRVAKRVAPGVDFRLADARTFSFNHSFDGAISAFNSLAHAHYFSDLIAILGSIRRSLTPGAPLCFDLSMEQGYLARWRGEFSVRIDGASFTVRPTYDPVARTARNEIIVHNSNGIKNRLVTILQHCHSEGDIRSAAQVAGFESFASYDAEQDLGLPGQFGHKFFLLR